MNVQLRIKTQSFLTRGMEMLESAVNLLYDGEWEDSIVESFRAARVHLVAILKSHDCDPGNSGLAGLLRELERVNGRGIPEGLLSRSQKLDRMYLLIRKGTASSLGWKGYHDEEQCTDMIHNARSIIKFCRGSINRTNSHHSL
jgi:HEPN domain-containing protein